MKSILSKTIFFYFLFAIISLQVIFWFHGNNIINNNDFSFMLSPNSDTVKLLYRWDHTRGLGISQDRNAATLVYTSLLSVIYFFVNNISSVEKILFYIWVLFSFISIFTLIKFFLKKESNNLTLINIVAFIASLLYGMNPWLHNFRWGNGMLIAMFIYSIGPLILYFLLNILENNDKVLKNKYFIYFLLANIFALPSYENPAYFIAFYITVLIPLILIYRKEIWKNKKLYLIYMVLFIIFNLWWVLRPMSFFESSAYIDANSPTSNNVLRSLDFRDSSFLELFRLQGFWASKFPEYFPYSTYYFKNGLIIFGSLFIFSLSFLFLFFRKRINYLIWFATFLFLFFILKGLHPPFDSPFEWLIDNTWFRIFRMSMDKFGSMVILFFSLFLSLSLLRIYKFKKNIGIIIVTLAFFFILLNAYPFLINKVVPSNDAASKVTNGAQYLKKYYQIPDNYYNGIGSLAEKKNDRKYVIFPDNPDHVFSSWNMYEWSGITVDPLWNLLRMSPYLILNNHGNSIGVSPQMSPSIQSIHKYYENNFNDYFKNIGKQLSILNSDYIIFRNDNSHSEIYKQNKITREQIFNELNNNKDIKLISKSGELSVYKINSQFFSPHFYAPKEIILTPNPVSVIPYIVSNPDYKIGSAIYSNKSPEDNGHYAAQKTIDHFFKNSTNIYIKPFKYTQKKSDENEFILSDAQSEKKFNLYKLINETTPIIINYDKQSEKIIINIISENIFRLNDDKKLGDKKILPLKEIKASEGEMLKIGKEYLIIDKNFSYEITIKDLPEEIKLYKTKENSENLLTNKDRDKNNSFEQGLWRDKTQDCSNEMGGKPQLKMYLSDDATEGNKSLELGSKNHSSCTFKNFSIKLSKNKVYEYSFDYKNVKGDNVQYYYNLIGSKAQSGFFETIDIKINNNWNHFRTIIEPQEDAESIDLVFYAFSDGAGEIINRFDNVKLVESELSVSKTEIPNNIVIQENIKLENNNKIEYINPNKDSLVISASFEQGLWQNKVTDCSQDVEGEPQMSMNLSDDATEGNKSLELGSKNHNACTFILFPAKLNKNKIYKYSFDYKNVKGKTVQYYYNLKGKEKQSDFIERIDVKINNSWNHFETFIELQEDVEYIDLVFYAPSDGIEEVVNRFDNIKLEEWMPKDIFNYYLYSPAKEKIETPVLEFKKIDPTKYRIRVHGAKGDFPLVFSESFHNGWKAYLTENQKSKIKNQNLNDYKILDGNEEDQASREELAGFIDKKWVTDLGNNKQKTIAHNKWEDGKEKLDYIEKYNIDFVSKNFQDTIQNDNLPGGNIWETWFKKPLPEENHLTANGYANSWWINLDDVCKNNNSCIKNADESYDFEMVVEFWPQRLFYAGLAISGLTLLSCLSYLFWISRRRIYKLLISIKSKAYGTYKIVISKEAMKAEINKFTKPIASKIYRVAGFIKSKVNYNYNRGQRKNYEKDTAEFASSKKLMNLEKKRLAMEKDKLDLEKEKLLIDNRKNEIEKQKTVIIPATNIAAKNYDENILTDSNIDNIDLNFVNERKPEIEQRMGKVFTNSINLLQELGCLTTENIPTYAGILLFGKNPQKYFKNSYLTFVKYDQNLNQEENINFKGNLIEIIENSFKRIKELIPVKEVVNDDTVRRQKVPNFPYIAVRELLINAVAHRDYTISGSRIIISMYEDRMEFQSPGGLPNNITPETILKAQYNRNPIIAETLYYLGYIEQLGSDMDRVFKSLKDLNKEKPTIEDFGNSVIVTIYK